MIFCLVFLIKQTWAEQSFTYEITDSIYIPPNSNSLVQNTVNTRTDEYLSAGEISLTANLTQFPVASSFNLLYFNMSNTNNLSCYTNWLQGELIETSLPCTDIIDTDVQCMNYTGCKDQNVYFQFSLSQELHYLSSLLYIENKDPNMVVIVTQVTSIKVTASNIWFYVGIAFVCLLLLNIVILTGVAFYWNLKYKKTQKKYEQFKLTGQDDVKNQ